MQKLKIEYNNSMFAFEMLPTLLLEILRYADTEDIGTFLRNCTYNADPISRNAIEYKIEEVEHNNNRYEIVLLEILLAYPYVNCKEYVGSKKLHALKEKLIFQPVYLHLFALCACYNSYFCFTDRNNKNYCDKNHDNDEIIDEILSYKGCKSANISNTEMKNIIHLLIDNYSKYRFYYYFILDVLIKIEFISDDLQGIRIVETQYTLIDTDRTTFIYNKENGFKIDMHTSFKRTSCNCADIKLEAESIGLKYLKSINKSITKILNYVPETCTWCNPDYIEQNKKKKCDNCKNLLEELNYIKNLSGNSDIRKMDFNKKISETAQDATNIRELREKRKDFLCKLLKQLKKDKNIEPDLINRLKTSIDICFGTPDILK